MAAEDLIYLIKAYEIFKSPSLDVQSLFAGNEEKSTSQNQKEVTNEILVVSTSKHLLFFSQLACQIETLKGSAGCNGVKQVVGGSVLAIKIQQLHDLKEHNSKRLSEKVTFK